MNKLSILGYIAGAFIILSSTVRWFFLWYDPSQVILGVGIGLIICIFAYLYGWMNNTDAKIEETNKRVDSFVKWMAKEEFK